MFLHFSSILFSSLISLIFSIKSFVRVFSLFSKSLFVSNFFRAKHFCQKGAKVEGKTLDQTVVSPPPSPVLFFLSALIFARRARQREMPVVQ